MCQVEPQYLLCQQDLYYILAITVTYITDGSTFISFYAPKVVANLRCFTGNVGCVCRKLQPCLLVKSVRNKICGMMVDGSHCP